MPASLTFIFLIDFHSLALRLQIFLSLRLFFFGDNKCQVLSTNPVIQSVSDFQCLEPIYIVVIDRLLTKFHNFSWLFGWLGCSFFFHFSHIHVRELLLYLLDLISFFPAHLSTSALFMEEHARLFFRCASYFLLCVVLI